MQYNYLAQHFIKVATKIHYKLIPTVACIQELQNASLQQKKIVLHLSVVHFSEQFHTIYNKQINKPYEMTEWNRNYSGSVKKKFPPNQLLLHSLLEFKFPRFSSQINEFRSPNHFEPIHLHSLYHCISVVMKESWENKLLAKRAKEQKNNSVWRRHKIWKDHFQMSLQFVAKKQLLQQKKHT